MAVATQILDQLQPSNPHISVTVDETPLNEPRCPGTDVDRWVRLRRLLNGPWSNNTKTLLIAWDDSTQCWKRWEEP